jgi:hypothetical protein
MSVLVKSEQKDTRKRDSPSTAGLEGSQPIGNKSLQKLDFLRRNFLRSVAARARFFENFGSGPDSYDEAVSFQEEGR